MTFLTKSSPLDKALVAVAELEGKVATWEADGAAKTLELDDLEKRAGDEVLDDPDAAVRLSGQMATLRAGVEVADRAVIAARVRLAQARRAVLPEQAAELRAQARKLKADADQLDHKAAPLLEQLQALMGASYGPATNFGGSSHGIQEPTKPSLMRRQAAALTRKADELDQLAEHGTDDQVAGKAAAAAKTSAPATVAG